MQNRFKNARIKYLYERILQQKKRYPNLFRYLFYETDIDQLSILFLSADSLNSFYCKDQRKHDQQYCKYQTNDWP